MSQVPVFVSIFAWVFLKEPCGFFQILSVGLTMVGLVLTTKLPLLFDATTLRVHNATELLNKTVAAPTASTELSQHHFIGVAAAIASTFFAASVYVVVRKARSAHHSVIMFNFGWVATLETLLITFVMDGFSMPKYAWEWRYIG